MSDRGERGRPRRAGALPCLPEHPGQARQRPLPGPNAEPLPYILVTGKKLADSHEKLRDQGPLGEGISITELGTSLYDEHVAANTTPGGKSHAPDQHCQGWTSADPLHKARAGLTFVSEQDNYADWFLHGGWVSRLTLKCDWPLHLYCLEI